MLRVSFLERLTIAVLVLLSAAWIVPAASQAPAKISAKDTNTQQGSPDSELCQRAHARAREILAALDPKVSSAVKAFASSILAKAGTAAPPDVVWDEFAGIAYLRGHPDTALWAEVHALALNWRAEYVAHAGVYLLNLKNVDDAKLFLHCAYDMGWRSPSLFEALALAYSTSKDQDKAKEYIVQAQELNPDDQILQAESSLISSGTLPPIPPRKKDDLDWMLDELERHFRDVNGRLRATIQLRDQMDKIIGIQVAAGFLQSQIRWEANMRQQIERIRQVDLPLARMSLEDFRKTRIPDASPQLHAVFVAGSTDLVIFECAFQYMMITVQEIQSLTAYYDQGFWDLDLWAHAMHTDVISYARQSRADRALLESAGMTNIFPTGYDVAPGNSGFARYIKAYAEAAEIENHYPDRSREGHVAWCAHVIPAYQDWKTTATSQYRVAADGFNGAAKQLLGWGGAEVADARGYVAHAMRGYRLINYTRTGNQGEDRMVESYATQANSYRQLLNGTYRRLVDMAAGNPQNIQSAIPNLLLSNKQTFLRMEQATESDLTSTAKLLTSSCSSVAAEVLKKLDGSEADATTAELFNELVNSFDGKLDPTSWCEFSLTFLDVGSASAHITFDWEKMEYHTETTAEWEFTKDHKSEESGEGGEGAPYGGTTTIFDSHGDPIQSEVTIGGSVSYDILRGYGEASIVAEKDPATGTWKRVAEVKSSVGLGVGKEHVGEIACYPAELNLKFEPREVMQKAVRFLVSQNSHTQ
jgi:hypothetical protein